MKITIAISCLLMYGSVVAMKQENINDDRDLFLQCWDIYLEEYIKSNNIKLNTEGQKDGVAQWQEKIKSFKEKFKKVELLYEEWSKGKDFENTLYKRTTVEQLKFIRDGTMQIDNALVGDCHWLLVALGLAKSYFAITEDAEYTFLKSNEEKCKQIGITIQSNGEKGYKIEVDNAFFDDSFIEKGIQIQELFPFIKTDNENFDTYYQVALKCGTVPYIVAENRKLKDMLQEEGKWVLGKNLEDILKLCNNFCILLIPRRVFLANQTAYVILYGRLIQYALVYLLGFDYYKNSVKLKANSLYKNSWITDKKVSEDSKMTALQSIFWTPEIYDSIKIISENNNVKTLLKNLDRYSSDNVKLSEDDKNLIKDYRESKDELIKMVYQRYEKLLERLSKQLAEEQNKEEERVKQEKEKKKELGTYDQKLYIELYNPLNKVSKGTLFSTLFDNIENKNLFLTIVKKANNKALFLDILNKMSDKNAFLQFYQNNSVLFLKAYNDASDKNIFFNDYNKAQNKAVFLQNYKEPFFKNFWNRGKKWILGGTAIGAALSSYFLYKYLRSSQKPMQKKNQ